MCTLETPQPRAAGLVVRAVGARLGRRRVCPTALASAVKGFEEGAEGEQEEKKERVHPFFSSKFSYTNATIARTSITRNKHTVKIYGVRSSAPPKKLVQRSIALFYVLVRQVSHHRRACDVKQMSCSQPESSRPQGRRARHSSRGRWPPHTRRHSDGDGDGDEDGDDRGADLGGGGLGRG